MIKRPNTNAQRLKRHKRVRAKISGTPEMPRLNVFRSNAKGNVTIPVEVKLNNNIMTQELKLIRQTRI